jgi:hypothetical protein
MDNRGNLIIGLLAVLITGLGVIVAILAWLYPRSPAMPTPFTLNQTESPNLETTSLPSPTITAAPATDCFPQTNWTPPNLTESSEWIYDCLTSGAGNWVGQSEQWTAENWRRGSGQSEIVNIVVPQGASTMGIGCNPCTIMAPNGATFSRSACRGQSVLVLSSQMQA